MKKIYIIGDMDTVSAFRLSGVEGVIAARDDAPSLLEEVIKKGTAGIVIMTSELAEDLQERIAQVNLAMEGPVVIEIPGIDETDGPRRSVVGYIAEALGISLES
ncbi:MAG: V-type ATP synthase subunit F [Deltaproteobacteria bacterium]|nr:V-type ATP synthase subunit F [Deltaproteobacteria bacterium]